MGVFTAFTTVMVPRVSELLSEGDTPKLQKIANDTFQVLTVVSIPIILFCVCCSSEVITLIAGPGYEGAYLPFKIVIVLLLIIGMEQIVIQQFLMAAQSSKPIFIVSSVGAVVGISMNAMLTPRFGAVGSSISWGVSELAVLCFGLVLAKKHVGVSFNLKFFLKNLGWSLVYLPLPLALFFLVKLPFGVNLVVNGLVFFVLFLLINLKLNKNQLLGEGIVKIMGKMRNLISKG
jgi:O-antigen/teichoic acid export membrane protein